MAGFGQSRDRAERLVLLSAALSLGTPRTLPELRDRFGLYAGKETRAMQKQFERDREDLRDAGIVIETITLGTDSTYQIRRRTRPIALTEEELDVLAVLSASIADPTTGAALATLAQEAGMFPADRTGGRAAITEMQVPDAVATALIDGLRLEASYRDARDNVAVRTFEPWHLVHRKGLTYVVSFDVDRGESRNFRLDRFDPAEPPKVVGTAEHARPDEVPGPVYPIELHDFMVDAPVAARHEAADVGGTVRLSSAIDDRVRLTFPGFRAEPILAWVLRHHARILEPADQASELERRLRRLVERHDKAPAEVEVPKTPKARKHTLTVDRVRRLMVLPGYLARLHGVTRAELASALGCTVEELDVELELLDTLELPGRGYIGEVVEEKGQLVYIRHEHRPEVDLTPADAIRLLILIESLRPLLDIDVVALDGIRDKLRTIVPGAVTVELAGEHHRDLPVIRKAIANRDVIRFEYRGRKDEVRRTRQVAPDQFRVAHGAVYVAGTDVASGEERQFRLDRMGDVDLVGTVPVLAAESVTPQYVPTEPEVEVLLLLDHAASWLLTHLTPVATEARDDGSTVALVRTDAVPWLASHVRAAGGAAEVISPQDLRATIASDARDVLDRPAIEAS